MMPHDMFLRAAGAARHFKQIIGDRPMTDLNRRSALSLALAATAAAATRTPADAQDQQRIDPASIEALRIYPPLGIARVGNAAEAEAYVIGPEVIGGPPTRPRSEEH